MPTFQKTKDGAPSDPESDDGGDGSDDTEPKPMPKPSDPESEDSGDDGDDSADPTPVPTPTSTESDSPDDNTEAPVGPGGDDSGDDGECADPVLEHDQVRTIPRTFIKRERSQERCRGRFQERCRYCFQKRRRTFPGVLLENTNAASALGMSANERSMPVTFFLALSTVCARCSLRFSPRFRLTFFRQSVADLLAEFRSDFFILSCRANFLLSCSAAARTTPGLPAASLVFSARKWRSAGLRYEYPDCFVQG